MNSNQSVISEPFAATAVDEAYQDLKSLPFDLTDLLPQTEAKSRTERRERARFVARLQRKFARYAFRQARAEYAEQAVGHFSPPAVRK